VSLGDLVASWLPLVVYVWLSAALVPMAGDLVRRFDVWCLDVYLRGVSLGVAQQEGRPQSHRTGPAMPTSGDRNTTTQPLQSSQPEGPTG